MSANEKELRASQKAERKASAAAEQDKKNRRYRRNAIIIGVILVILIAFALLVNSNYFYTHTTALTVGETKYTPAEVSYFYRSTYNAIYQNLYKSLGDYTNMVLDTSKSLAEQEYPYGDEAETWADAVIQSAREDMVRVTSLYDAAQAAGRNLTAEEQSAIDSEIEQMGQYAASNGYSDTDKFLAAYFGKGMNLATYRRLQERVTLASAFSDELRKNFSYTDEELANYYSENADSYNVYYYYTFPLNSTDKAFEELSVEELPEKMHEAAQKIADATTDFDSLTAAVREYSGENTVLSIASNTRENVGPTYQEWVMDPARQKNDVAVFDTEDVSYVVLFVEYCQNDYPTVDFRHILVNAVPDEDGNYTQEALDTAKEKAELLLDTWRADPTEDNFAEMARLNSEDSGSTQNGGLYEGVTKYQMVPGVNDFLFDGTHDVGDVGIVFGQSSAYTGYHVMYFAGKADHNYSVDLADNDLRTSDYSVLYEAISSNYEIKEGSGLRFVPAL